MDPQVIKEQPRGKCANPVITVLIVNRLVVYILLLFLKVGQVF